MEIETHPGGSDVALIVAAVEDRRFLGELVFRNSRPCQPSERVPVMI